MFDAHPELAGLVTIMKSSAKKSRPTRGCAYPRLLFFLTRLAIVCDSCACRKRLGCPFQHGSAVYRRYREMTGRVREGLPDGEVYNDHDEVNIKQNGDEVSLRKTNKTKKKHSHEKPLKMPLWKPHTRNRRREAFLLFPPSFSLPIHLVEPINILYEVFRLHPGLINWVTCRSRAGDLLL